ncbi:transposase [Brevibacterium sp. FME17]|uniref:transposase n=1 Tax=Brevibacterium sp. FME17 TaxID=2742606 RepID=UPI0018660B81|nr:transposase [Brevibacterium sp. FME17]
MLESTAASLPRSGQDYPADLVQFRAWFPTDNACRDYIDWLRWPAGFACPHCQSTNALAEAAGYRCRSCKKRTSTTAGTIFDKTRTPLTDSSMSVKSRS